ncbi:4-hydroxy-3-methylbut-2-enyl diphosphate reductase [Thermotoga sp. KOL6]|uniref:4-hydroxy-3-methylbut-2-enyl diphosphate reductase n=1 Tax=Thermotoga sp. KOL6 TaxID=126741 RepID=UPI000C77A822|nr:4-hydroxy-3-methylbut-2-enyl diphosphate reductase [Thermotoga sp. KOL6]PLV60174.1 4-hydroxy-3-methylbut-2-enyl diphosphate reductase [Thermotoga sp. KOL6]
MKIIVAKSMGFCFGVEKAIKTVEELLNNGKKVITDGEIVHNKHVMNHLIEKGLRIVSKISKDADAVFAVRAHGIPKDKLEQLKRNYSKVVDLTCPIVHRLFKTAQEYSSKGKIIVFGKENHPEMIALKGYTPAIVTKKPFRTTEKKVVFLSQTTSSIEEYKKFVAEMIKMNDFEEVIYLNTICPVTIEREKEIEKLSKICDVCIVIGGKHSSNTGKLFQIASNNTKTLWIESQDELPNDVVKYGTVCVFSGTSTPISLIEDVIRKLKEMEGKDHGTNGIQ